MVVEIQSCVFTPLSVQQCSGDFTLSIDVEFFNPDSVTRQVEWAVDYRGEQVGTSAFGIAPGATEYDQIHLFILNSYPRCMPKGFADINEYIVSDSVVDI